MKKFRSVDELVRDSVKGHIEMCKVRQNNGFRVLEIEVPLEFASKVFNELNDEMSLRNKLPGWEFGIFKHGESAGKVAESFTRDNICYKRYFLKYTL